MHPAILVLDRPREGRPQRVPLVIGRPLRFRRQGFTQKLIPGDVGKGVLDGRLLTVGHRAPRTLAIDERFTVGRHRCSLTAGDDILVDPWRSGDLVLFHCFHAVDADVAWRGFRVDDPARALVDYAGGVVVPSTFGMMLNQLAAAGQAQGAHMDDAVEPMIVAARSHGRRRWRSWCAPCSLSPGRSSEPCVSRPRCSTSTRCRLRRRSASGRGAGRIRTGARPDAAPLAPHPAAISPGLAPANLRPAPTPRGPSSLSSSPGRRDL